MGAGDFFTFHENKPLIQPGAFLSWARKQWKRAFRSLRVYASFSSFSWLASKPVVKVTELSEQLDWDVNSRNKAERQHFQAKEKDAFSPGQRIVLGALSGRQCSRRSLYILSGRFWIQRLSRIVQSSLWLPGLSWDRFHQVKNAVALKFFPETRFNVRAPSKDLVNVIG